MGFTITQVQVLVDNKYDSQGSILYGKITDIKKWCQLKSKIPLIRDGLSYGDRKINCLHALDLWVKDLTLWGRIIDINNFKTDIIADTFEESWLDFEDIRYEKGDLSKPKEFSHEKWNQLEDIIYSSFASRKNSLGVTLSYVIITNTPGPEDSENRDVQIIHQESLVRDMFTWDSRKVIDIIKGLILGTDTDTWIEGLKCGRKSMQVLQAHYKGTS